MSPPIDQSKSVAQLMCFMCICCLLLLYGGVSIGSTGIVNLADLSKDPALTSIVWEIRLPRTLGSLFCGALLGLSGALAQGLFRNPLADPYLLGSASGATLGVVVPWRCGVSLKVVGIGSPVWG